MIAAGVDTAGYLTVDALSESDMVAARDRCARGNVVIKADGLAAGKGVFVCHSAEDAIEALDEVCSGRFGAAAQHIVLEDLLVGPEVSLFAISDGKRTVVLPSSQDHKTLLDGNRGPNTGGMGAYVPCPLVDMELGAELVQQIHQPVVDEMARRGTPFVGVLYAGLMMTPQGPKVWSLMSGLGIRVPANHAALGRRYSTPVIWRCCWRASFGNAHVRSRCLCMLCRGPCVCRISVVVNKGCPMQSMLPPISRCFSRVPVGPKTDSCDEWWSRVGSECPCGIDSGGNETTRMRH